MGLLYSMILIPIIFFLIAYIIDKKSIKLQLSVLQNVDVDDNEDGGEELNEKFSTEQVEAVKKKAKNLKRVSLVFIVIGGLLLGMWLMLILLI